MLDLRENSHRPSQAVDSSRSAATVQALNRGFEGKREDGRGRGGESMEAGWPHGWNGLGSLGQILTPAPSCAAPIQAAPGSL